nr:MAG TPA: hypothetical protein [Caudoviricetes sp.]
MILINGVTLVLRHCGLNMEIMGRMVIILE